MENVELRIWKVKDIEATTEPFKDLKDPHKFVAVCDAKWRSLVLKNPCQEPEDLAMVLAIAGDTIVGRLGFFQAKIRLHGQIHKTYWTDGFFLAPEYKSSGAGGMILLRSIGMLKTICAAGGPDVAAQKLYKASGFVFLGTMRRHIRVFKGKIVAGKLLGSSPLSGALGACITPVLGLINLLKPFKKPALRFEPVREYTSVVDDLFAQTTENDFVRDHNLLNWVITHRDVMPYMIYQGDQPKGYVLLKKYHHPGGGKRGVPPCDIGCILDWVLVEATAGDRRDLVHFAGAELKAKGVDLFEMNVFNKEFDDICNELGMIVGEGTLAFVRPPAGVKVTPEDPWFITPGAADMLLMKP